MSKLGNGYMGAYYTLLSTPFTFETICTKKKINIKNNLPTKVGMLLEIKETKKKKKIFT